MTQLLSFMRHRIDRSKDHGGLMTRLFLLLAIGVIFLVAHGLAFFLFLKRHLWVSSELASAILILLVLKHVGLLSSFYAFFRRQVRK